MYLCVVWKRDWLSNDSNLDKPTLTAVIDDPGWVSETRIEVTEDQKFMFTGIIENIGTVAQLVPSGGDLRIYVKCPDMSWDDVSLGDSIATNGVCLTAVELTGDGYWADVSQETIDVTTISNWAVGQRVNLEKALTPQTRLGGHMVSGHVDGIGEVLERYSDARSERFTLRAPKSIARYIAAKGSITVDGTSLTVNAVNEENFELNIVPHTLQYTVVSSYKKGGKVNLEVDLIARYLERLVSYTPEGENELSKSFLADHGFLK